jgi:hypothetical protein
MRSSSFPNPPREMTVDEKIAALTEQRDSLIAQKWPPGWVPHQVRDRLKEIERGLARLSCPPLR